MSADNSCTGDRDIYIANLRPHDVLSGRGAFTDRYFGNLWFRTLIRDRKDRHASAQKIDEKNQIVREVYQEVCQAGGRFLRKLAAEKDAGQQAETKDIWQPISKDKALEKIKQAFRDLSEAKTKRRRVSATLSKGAALSATNLAESNCVKPPAKRHSTNRRVRHEPQDPIIGMSVTGESLRWNNEDSILRQHATSHHDVDQLMLCRQVIARYQAMQQQQPPPVSISIQHPHQEQQQQRFELVSSRPPLGDQKERTTTTSRNNSLSRMLQHNQTSTVQDAVDAPTFALSHGCNSSYLDTTPSTQQIAVPRVAQHTNVLNSASFDVASILLPDRNPNPSQAPSVNDTACPLNSRQGTANGTTLGGGPLGGTRPFSHSTRPTLSTLAAQPSLLLPLVVDERNWRLLLEAFPAQLALIQANVAPPFSSRDLSILLDISRFALLDTSTAVVGTTALQQLHTVLSTVASLPSQQLELTILDWESLVLVSRSVHGSLPASVP
jgi:hypothetical protein